MKPGALLAGFSYPEPLDAVEREGQWRALWNALGLPAQDSLLAALEAAWGEPWRRYHDRRHLGECLSLLASCQALARRPAEVGLAIWFHDAVYRPMEPDNERRSAAWAVDTLVRAGASEEVIQRVRDLVMATRHDSGDHLGGDAGLLSDIDLAIFGASPQRFTRYEQDIRLEYAQVPDAVYRPARIKLLQDFLQRRAIYCTPELERQFEERARVNLRASLNSLLNSPSQAAGG